MGARLAGVILGIAALVAAGTASAGEDAGVPQQGAAIFGEDLHSFFKATAAAPIYTPLPLYVELPEGSEARRVMVAYKPFGFERYKRIEMERMDRGFGVLISCEELTTTGHFSYYFAFLDENGRVFSALGTPQAPFRVSIVNEVEGEPPRLPGQNPPARCPNASMPDPTEWNYPASPPPDQNWPWPLPQARAKGCAGCSAAASGAGGVPLAWIAVLAAAVSRARGRRSAGGRTTVER